MKLFSFLIISFFNLVLSQNLIFYNSQGTIIFKENELININGQKFRYLGGTQYNDQIVISKNRLLKNKMILLNIHDINTFQKYSERFSLRNAFRKGFSGFKIGFLGLGSLGFLSGWSWDRETGLGPSSRESLALGTIMGVIMGAYGGLNVGAMGFIYGFITLGEGKLNDINNYQLKLD